MSYSRRELVLLRGGDAGVIERLVRLEQKAVLAYTELADVPIARVFARQDQEHADALTRALRRLGGSPPPKPTAVDVGDPAGAMRFAVQLETQAVGAYYQAIGKLKAPELLPTVTSIMANRAQHLAVLRQALGRNPSPEAFVTGGERPSVRS